MGVVLAPRRDPLLFRVVSGGGFLGEVYDRSKASLAMV